MDNKTMNYLFYKVRGADRETILKEAELTETEYAELEQSLRDEVTAIQAERTAHPHIGQDFVRLTHYIYDHESAQSKGEPCPPAFQPLEGEIIPLPAPDTLTKPDITLAQAIAQRRSLRNYTDKPLSQAELSWLLWSTQWIREHRVTPKMELGFRQVPSAGCRHPLETYLLLNRVKGIAPGLYYYHPLQHGLVLYKSGAEQAQAVCEACLGQEMVLHSAVTFIWLAIPYRASWRYSQRSYRYLYLDAGHAGQNLHLAAEAIGAGACMIGAYNDAAMNALLQANGTDAFVIYAAALGKKTG